MTFGGYTSSPISPKRGVRQGDPLFSTLFLIVMDFVLRALPDRLGAARGESPRLSYIAYADDILLSARGAACLHELLTILFKVLLSTGLEINMDKSVTFSWKANKKSQKVLYDKYQKFVRGRPLRTLAYSEHFLYLGVSFSVNGRIFRSPAIDEDLMTLKKAYLKPQQKLFFLTHMLLPKYYHSLVLGKIRAGHLKKLDLKIRGFLRDLLHLPHDFPSSAF